MNIYQLLIRIIRHILVLVICLSMGNLYAKGLQSNNNAPLTEPMTTAQVKKAIKKKHKGRIVYIKRKASRGHPNCHIVKMVTATGEFKYIRYACGR